MSPCYLTPDNSNSRYLNFNSRISKFTLRYQQFEMTLGFDFEISRGNCIYYLVKI